MLINASFLAYKPQQIAAVSLLLGMRMKQLKNSSLANENLANADSLEAAKATWNSSIESLTGLEFERDLR